MIRTLKITTVLAAIICVCLVGFVGAFGLKGDPQVEKFLAESSFVDGLKDVIAVARTDTDEMSPLVRQAQLFAKRINPPPPPKPPAPPKPVAPTRTKLTTRSDPPEPPRPPSVKFEVIATCRYPDDPDKSMALLSLPAKGLKWVRVNEHLEHLIVAEITDAGVVMSDNGRTRRTVPMKQTPSIVRSLLAEEGHTPAPAPASTGMVYTPLTTSPDPILPKGSAYVPAARTRKLPVSRTMPRPPVPAGSRQRRTYAPPGRSGSRPPTKPVAPSPEERKAILDDNISDIKRIIAKPNPSTSKADQKEEHDALSKLLELLEKERRRADTDEDAPKNTATGTTKAQQSE